MYKIVAFVFFLVASFAGAAPNILFILDGSGSMWGQIDGRAKIEIAREVMTGLVDDLPSDASVGLMAYGHRRKGDCKDIEMLVDLGPLDRKDLIKQIEGIQPKGKTPITAAVELAVKQVRTRENSTSIVLVSDGKESCGGDPCAAVRAAKKRASISGCTPWALI